VARRDPAQGLAVGRSEAGAVRTDREAERIVGTAEWGGGGEAERPPEPAGALEGPGDDAAAPRGVEGPPVGAEAEPRGPGLVALEGLANPAGGDVPQPHPAGDVACDQR